VTQTHLRARDRIHCNGKGRPDHGLRTLPIAINDAAEDDAAEAAAADKEEGEEEEEEEEEEVLLLPLSVSCSLIVFGYCDFVHHSLIVCVCMCVFRSKYNRCINVGAIVLYCEGESQKYIYI
jgi:hypothetical protein